MPAHESIVRIFRNLKLIYGAQFRREYLEGFNEEDVRELWAQRLKEWLDKPYAIAWALDNLPVRCPNVIEFQRLCQQAPRPVVPKLPEPPPPLINPERRAEIQRMIDALVESSKKPAEPVEPPAYRVFQKIQRGEPVPCFTKEFYKKDLEKYENEMQK